MHGSEFGLQPAAHALRPTTIEPPQALSRGSKPANAHLVRMVAPNRFAFFSTNTLIAAWNHAAYRNTHAHLESHVPSRGALPLELFRLAKQHCDA